MIVFRQLVLFGRGSLVSGENNRPSVDRVKAHFQVRDDLYCIEMYEWYLIDCQNFVHYSLTVKYFTPDKINHNFCNILSVGLNFALHTQYAQYDIRLMTISTHR